MYDLNVLPVPPLDQSIDIGVAHRVLLHDRIERTPFFCTAIACARIGLRLHLPQELPEGFLVLFAEES